MEAHTQSIMTANTEGGAFFGLKGAEKSLNDGGLSCSCSSYDGHLLIGTNLKGNSFEYFWQSRVVPCRKIFELYLGDIGPFLMKDLSFFSS